MEPIELLWENILSRDPQRIKAAFQSLTEEDQASIIRHLNRMVEEEGWHKEQRASARSAIRTIKTL